MADTALTTRAAAVFDRLLKDRDHALVAVSGGPDSMALLALLAEWRAAAMPMLRLCAATVDHGLRPEAAAEAAMAASLSASFGIAHIVLRWEAEKPSAGIQEAARQARYALLEEHALSIGASCLFTAHHADDQAETVLMRLAGGSGIAGLAGMRDAADRGRIALLRPLLAFRKSALVAFCRQRSIPFAADPSNADRRFARGRLRSIEPALAAEGLSVERLCRLAMRAARAEEALAAAAARAFDAALLKRTDCLLRIDWRGAAASPAEIRLRVLAQALALHAGAAPRLEQLEAMLNEVDEAFAAGRRLRRTLAGRLVTLMAGGILAVGPAPSRRRS